MTTTTATAKTLNDLMTFGHIVRVQPDGKVSDLSPNETVWAPELLDALGTLDQHPMHTGWELLSGYSGAYGQAHSPMMHPFEFIGGRLARDILDRPGLYVALYYETEWAVAYRPECWHVGQNAPGYLPENDPQCFTTYDDAVTYLRDAMREWADEDDEAAYELIDSTVLDEEKEDALAEVSTRATVDAILTDDGPSDTPAPFATIAMDNDDRARVWWITPTYHCDHADCEHDDE